MSVKSVIPYLYSLSPRVRGPAAFAISMRERGGLMEIANHRHHRHHRRDAANKVLRVAGSPGHVTIHCATEQKYGVVAHEPPDPPECWQRSSQCARSPHVASVVSTVPLEHWYFVLAMVPVPPPPVVPVPPPPVFPGPGQPKVIVTIKAIVATCNDRVIAFLFMALLPSSKLRTRNRYGAPVPMKYANA
jgi:hypothetical protein